MSNRDMICVVLCLWRWWMTRIWGCVQKQQSMWN
jgi:hypothetical protein